MLLMPPKNRFGLAIWRLCHLFEWPTREEERRAWFRKGAEIEHEKMGRMWPTPSVPALPDTASIWHGPPGSWRTRYLQEHPELSAKREEHFVQPVQRALTPPRLVPLVEPVRTTEPIEMPVSAWQQLEALAQTEMDTDTLEVPAFFAQKRRKAQ